MRAFLSFRPLRVVAAFALALATADAASGEETHPLDGREREVLSGPVEARVLKVIDGDTFVAKARIWLGQDVETRVRIADLDTPEKRGRCEAERAMALRAQALAEDALAAGWVHLHDITYDKFGKRVVARVSTADGRDLAELLKNAGLGRSYGGGHKVPWCDMAAGQR